MLKRREAWVLVGAVALVTAALIATFFVVDVSGPLGVAYLVALWFVAVGSLLALHIRTPRGVRYSDLPLRHGVILVVVAALVIGTVLTFNRQFGVEAVDSLGEGLLAGMAFAAGWNVGDLVASLLIRVPNRPTSAGRKTDA